MPESHDSAIGEGWRESFFLICLSRSIEGASNDSVLEAHFLFLLREIARRKGNTLESGLCLNFRFLPRYARASVAFFPPSPWRERARASTRRESKQRERERDKAAATRANDDCFSAASPPPRLCSLSLSLFSFALHNHPRPSNTRGAMNECISFNFRTLLEREEEAILVSSSFEESDCGQTVQQSSKFSDRISCFLGVVEGLREKVGGEGREKERERQRERESKMTMAV